MAVVLVIGAPRIGVPLVMAPGCLRPRPCVFLPSTHTATSQYGRNLILNMIHLFCVLYYTDFTGKFGYSTRHTNNRRQNASGKRTPGKQVVEIDREVLKPSSWD
jgi:hypothetical protein